MAGDPYPAIRNNVCVPDAPTAPDADLRAKQPFVPEPSRGRVFEGARTVRSTDVTPAGRFRFDALARSLQDVAEDDVAATGWQAPYGWLLRRCAATVHGYPRLGDRLVLRTFCSATGSRWAQRTTTVAGPGGPLIQAVAIWTAVDLATGLSCPLGEEFFRFYGAATEGRTVSARLSLPRPDADTGPDAGNGATAGTGPDAGTVPDGGRDWPLRSADLDTAGHVNNAIHWAAAEDVLARLDWLPAVAELEYHRPILPGCRPRLLTSPSSLARPGGPTAGAGPAGADRREVHFWLLAGTERLAAGRLAR